MQDKATRNNHQNLASIVCMYVKHCMLIKEMIFMDGQWLQIYFLVSMNWIELDGFSFCLPRFLSSQRLYSWMKILSIDDEDLAISLTWWKSQQFLIQTLHVLVEYSKNWLFTSKGPSMMNNWNLSFFFHEDANTFKSVFHLECHIYVRIRA